MITESNSKSFGTVLNPKKNWIVKIIFSVQETTKYSLNSAEG